ncbi:MAG TPA: amidase, partial [Methylomirabilota bacterium]|nr:amidase [Methylomirabilota bacterium]
MTDELCFTDATELAARIRRRDISVTEVVQAHLAQIERVNPKVNAVVTLTAERALDEARAKDAALAHGEAAGPLFGLPVVHKDLVPTRGIRTTFGSPIYRDHVPDVDALIVERLRAAGAITLGKSNTPEFGAGSQTFNEVFGRTLNPYDPTKTCGGSSGGAAVALACGMVPIADGSDMGGSLRNPAAFCNVVGLRPAPGRVPVWPTGSAWMPFSVQGPMARTVADVALLLSVMAGPDPRSPIAIRESGEPFRAPLERDFKGVCVAWSQDLGGLPIDGRVREVLTAQRKTFETLGCVVEDGEPDFKDAREIFQTWRAVAFAAKYGPLLAQHRRQMKDTVVWNIEQAGTLSARDVGDAEVRRTELYHRVREFMERHEFLLLPTTQVPPFDVTQAYVTEIDGVRLPTYIDWMRACSDITVTGLPAISVPAGFTADGLPVGLQIVGRHQDEWGVLQLARAFEQATGFGRRRAIVVGGGGGGGGG